MEGEGEEEEEEGKRETTVLSGAEERWGRRSQPGSFLFFTSAPNLVLIFQSVFESHTDIACSAYTVLDVDVARAHNACRAAKRLKCFDPLTWSRFEVSSAAEEVVFTANVVCV